MGVGVEEVILEEMEEEHAAEIGMSTEISNNFYIWYIYYFLLSIDIKNRIGKFASYLFHK